MNSIIDLLAAQGPQTGKEIMERVSMDIFQLWKACNQDNRIITKVIGKRYLRLDKHVEGFARLSPSILREFCNYSVIGLEEQTDALNKKANELHQNIISISNSKFDLAKNIMENIISSKPSPEMIRERVCFMIAGDVTYEMAHLEARPEFSTGRLVNGSDLDIVVVYRDLPTNIVKSIDSSIYNAKYKYLCNPVYKEEIDYVIKDIGKVEKQLAFDSFEAMVASKVLNEGKYLCGSPLLYEEIKRMVLDFGIPEKLAALKEKAEIDRENAKKRLLELYYGVINDKEMGQLFYTTNEREEFF